VQVKEEQVAKVSALSDDELKKVANSKMPSLQDERLHLLLDKQQEGNLNIEERRELRHLMKTYSKGMLEKSEALAEAHKRKLVTTT
jgi:uncharacterized FlgJ-related protein